MEVEKRATTDADLFKSQSRQVVESVKTVIIGRRDILRLIEMARNVKTDDRILQYIRDIIVEVPV